MKTFLIICVNIGKNNNNKKMWNQTLQAPQWGGEEDIFCYGISSIAVHISMAGKRWEFKIQIKWRVSQWKNGTSLMKRSPSTGNIFYEENVQQNVNL